MTDQRPDDTAQAPAPAEHEPTGPQGLVDEPAADEVVQTPGTDDVDPDADPDAETAAQAPRDDESEDVPDWEALAADDPRSRGELLAELTEAESRRDEYLDDVRRARAEFENYRKRMLREAQQMRSAGAADLATGLLDVLDDFDRTLDAAEQSDDPGLAKGVEMVYGKLVEVLRNAGLSRVDEAGVAFDPERHEAVQQVPADEPRDEPVVAEVLRPGYEIAGRVIRAAMVAVEQ